MGRWPYSDRKTVEDCLSISTTFLNNHHLFDDGINGGEINWSCNGKETGRVNLVVSTIEFDEYIRFQYTLTNRHRDGKPENIDYKARLDWTACQYGGRRWWLVCPLVVNAKPCIRRVVALYLGEKYFGCRHCYDLTYESSKESHKFDRLFRDIGITAKQGKQLFK